MEPYFESKHHDIEDDYWWFRGRRDIQYQLLKDEVRGCSTLLGTPSRAQASTLLGTSILDIGCAGGHLMRMLQEKGFTDITGIDISQKALDQSREKDIEKVYLRDASQTGFPDESFDVIVSGDILEHIKDDRKAITEWKRVLRKNGRLIIFVPAHSFLWSGHDETCNHFRRYSRGSLERILKGAGLKIEKMSYWNFSMFFPVFVMRMAKRLLGIKGMSGDDDFIRLGPALNSILKKLLISENRVLRHMDLPMGVSVLAVARKS